MKIRLSMSTEEPGVQGSPAPNLRQQRGKRHKAGVGKRGRDVVGDTEEPVRGFQCRCRWCHVVSHCSPFFSLLFLLAQP